MKFPKQVNFIFPLLRGKNLPVVLAVFLVVCVLRVYILESAEPPLPVDPPADPPGEYESFQPVGDIRRFEGETLSYDISFLMFDKAATATVTFYKKDNHYESLLVAETKGFVGWITSNRKHTYKTTFELLDNNTRLRSSKFEREVIIGNNKERSTNTLDYTTRTHYWTEFKNGIESKSIEEIPLGITFDDILTAFYNFRNSVYGKIEKGARFEIHTIPEKGVNKLTVHIKNEREEEEARKAQGRKKGEEYLLRVIIPKEIFKTKNGELLFWSSKHFIPTSTIIVEYIMLGDLHANLVSRTINKPPPENKMSN